MVTNVWSLLYILSGLPGILCLFSLVYHFIFRPNRQEDARVPLLDQNFLNFMPGIDRRELEEQLVNEERWICPNCEFSTLDTIKACCLCGCDRERALDRLNSTIQHRISRMRRRWTRRMDDSGRVEWKEARGYTSEIVEPFCIISAKKVEIQLIVDKNTPIQVMSSSITLDSLHYCVLVSEADASATITGYQPSIWDSLLSISQLTFSSKYAWFLLQTQNMLQPFKKLYLEIKTDRNLVFEDATRDLLSLEGSSRCAIARHSFIGEAAIDAGAVQREWYSLVSQSFVNQELFIITNSTDNSYYINPIAVNEMNRQAYEAVGRFIGRALLNGQLIPLQFCSVFFKILLGSPIVFEDLESLDPSIYRSLQFVHTCDDVLDLALTFSATACAEDNSLVEVDLVPSGHEQKVQELNKLQYIQAMTEFVVFGRVKQHISAIIQGLYDIVPPELLVVFDHKELEFILCGHSTIDMQDWKQNTVASQNLKETPVLLWFWDVVESLSSADQEKLLQFSTGSSRVPVQGFKGLTSYDGRICYFTLNGVLFKPGAYPVVHACFNRIDLPLYPTKELLKEALETLLLSDPTGFNTI